MARPNIDVPWSVHGSVKEYANQNGITLSEAYTELLSNALELDK